MKGKEREWVRRNKGKREEEMKGTEKEREGVRNREKQGV